ncbi:sigma-70 family RNA polymerase sigma factor, partial [Actinosynnema sp. NPDC059797]
FEEYGQAVLAYARRLTGDHHAAEDVVQEAMIRTWRHAEKLLAEGGSVRRWLMTVVLNIVYDQVRARRGRPVEVEDVRSAAAVTGDHADRVVTDLVVVEALRGLPEELRSVVLHVYLWGDSVAETAAELRIPAGTVKSRTHRAMSVLRRRLPPAMGSNRSRNAVGGAPAGGPPAPPPPGRGAPGGGPPPAPRPGVRAGCR